MDEENKEEAPPPDASVDDGVAAEEDGGGASPPEKKVQLNDNPEFFELDPNSTDVKPMESPPSPKAQAKPCPPPIDQKHLDQIIADTMTIIEHSDKQCNDQKLFSQKVAFMLTCIQDSLGLYCKHTEVINTFLVNNEQLQTKWLCQTMKALKGYSDYALVTKDSPEKTSVNELPVPVPQSELKSVADTAAFNLFAGGTIVKSLRTICKGVNDKLDSRREFTEDHLEPFCSWFALLNKAADNQDAIRDMLFKVSANVSFLTTGEISDCLVLDLAKELESLNSKKSS